MAKNHSICLVLCRLSVAVLIAGFAFAGLGRAATVGAIPGHFSVTATGAATYSVPFELPAGIAGLTPHLGLAYSSRGGSGLVGYGWALSGFSTITRCSKTLASDGSNGGVTFSSDDRFCLDGNKLRKNIGTYGANDSTYRTEQETFARITSYTSGGAGAAPGTGPQWFTVETRNGLTYEYGKTADSEILNASGTAVRVWALDKISDKNGNSITFSYAIDSANGTYRPSQVEYTAHTGLTPSHTVIFDYALLPSSVNAPVRYIAGTEIRITRRLADIKLEYNGSAVMTYTLAYQDTSDAHRSRLTSLTECAGSDCLPPTDFTWLDGTVGFGADHNTNEGTETSDEYGSSHVMDFNGDGYADLVFPNEVPNEATGTWWIMFGSPNGLGGATNTGVSDAGYLYSRIIDYNSDGLADLLVTDSTTGKWRVLESTGSTFISQTTTLSYKNADGSSYAPNAEVVDFNGDGRDDLVWADGNGNFYWVKNVNGAFDPSTKKKVYSASNTTITSGPGFSVNRSTQALDSAPDFNGDGLPDLMAASQQTKTICDESGNCTPVITYTWVLLVSDGQGSYHWYGSLSRGSDIATPVFADVNGDGLTDVVWMEAPDSNPDEFDSSKWTWHVYLSTGSGLAPGIDTGILNKSLGGGMLVGDYNGDGRQDIYFANTSNWYALISDGSGNLTQRTLSFAATAGYASVGDFNGDGLPDLAGYRDGSWHYVLRAGAKPDLITKIIDGLGNYFTPSYAPLTGSVYTKGSGALFPKVDFQAPLYVVDHYTQNDPAGSSYSISYHYNGARLNLEGRGFLGFASVTTTDSRDNVTTTTAYDQAFPKTGMPTSITATQGDITLSKTTIDNQTKSFGQTTDHSDAYFPYVETRVEDSYDANGVGLNRVKVTDTYGDTYGELTKQVTDTGPANSDTVDFEATVLTGYTNDSTNWCLGLPTSVTVTRGGVSRKITYTNDTSHCRATSMTVGAGGTLPLKTTYIYGDYGNKTEIAVTGNGLSGRTTNIGYGTAKDFPVTMTNALGQVSSMTWDRGLGVKVSATDANGHTITWSYDGFGRKIKEARPDGSETDWTYDACGAQCGPEGRYEVTTDIKSGAIAGGHSETIYDAFGHPVEQRQLVLGGKTSITDILYDAFGRKSSVTTPYFSGATYCTTYTYDVLGRVIATDSPPKPCGATSGSQITYVYNGLTTTVTEPQGADALVRKKQIVHDVRGAIISVTDGYLSQTPTTTSYAYYPFGELKTVTDAEQHKTELTYNDRGMKATIDDPDMGDWSYTYDAAGELTSQKDAKGQTIAQEYDALGRLIQRTEPQPDGSSGVATWSYGTATDTTANDIGLLTGVTGPAGYSKSIIYDSLSRPSSITTIIDGSAYAIDKTYDGFSRLSTVTYPESAAVSPDSNPVANAGPGQTVLFGNTITLDGSASTDPDGAGLTYAWRQTNGPAGDLAGAANAIATFNPPAPGIYSFELLVSDGLENGTDAVTVTVEPNAPSSVSIAPSPSLDGNFTVNWSDVTGADCYQVQQSSSSTFPTVGQNCTGSGTSQSYYRLGNGSYYHRARAIGGGVKGPWSGTASVSVTLPPATPSAPTFNLNPTANGSFTVSWPAPAGPVSSYHLREQINGGTWHGAYTGGSNSWPTSGRGGGHYAYVVHACYQTACSDYSPSATEWVLSPPNTPAAPTFNVSYNISTNGAYTVSWSTPGGDNYNRRYLLQESYNGGAWTQRYYGAGHSWSTSGRGNGTYAYRLKAANVDAAGHAIYSGYSATASVYVAHPPGRPTASVSPNPVTTGSSYTLSWNTPSGHIAEYQAEVSKSSSFSGATPINEGTRHSASFPEDYEPGAYYPMTVYNRVRACNGTSSHPTAACGSWSATVSESVFCQSGYNATTGGAVSPNMQMCGSGGFGRVAPSGGNADPVVAIVPASSTPTPSAARRDTTNSPLAYGRDTRTSGVTAAGFGSILRYAPPLNQALRTWRIEPAAYTTDVTTAYRLKVVYHYDPSGMLAKVTNADGTVYWQATATNARGQLLSAWLGNGVTTQNTYDAATGALTQRQSGVGYNHVIQSLNYTYDTLGNLKSRENANQSLTEKLTYDALNRLTQSNLTAGGTTTTNLTVKYDEIGNITSKSGVGTYTYDTRPHAVQSISGTINSTYTYDADGNTLSGNGKTYAWTAFNKPWKIDANGAESQFWYAPDRSRYKQVTTAGGVTTAELHIGGLFEVIAQDGAATVYRHNIIAGGKVVAIYTNTSALTQQIRYLHYNALGSVNAITDGSGAVVARMSFSAFGVRRDPSDWQGPDPNVPNDRDQTFRGFTDQEELDAVGLIHYNGRVYDPQVGRFTSADPIVQAPYYSQSINRYSYAWNNPLTLIDPSGDCTDRPDAPCLGTIEATPPPWWYSGDGMPASMSVDTESPGGFRSGRGFETENGIVFRVIAVYNYVGGEDVEVEIVSVPGEVGGLTGGGDSPLLASRPGANESLMGRLADAITSTFHSYLAWRQGNLNHLNATFDAALAGDTNAGIEVGLMFMGGGIAKAGGELFQAVRGVAAAERGLSVLGHYPGYVDTAKSIGARYFNVPFQVWARMSPAEQWAANTRFLDRLISRGGAVILSTPASQARAGSWFARELEYLSSRGYSLSTDGTRMLPPVQ